MISRLFFDIVAGWVGSCVYVCVCVDPATRHTDSLSLWDLIVYKTSKPLHEDETQKSFKFLKGFIFDRNPTKAHKSVVSFSKVDIIIIAVNYFSSEGRNGSINLYSWLYVPWSCYRKLWITGLPKPGIFNPAHVLFLPLTKCFLLPQPNQTTITPLARHNMNQKTCKVLT